MSEDLFGFEPIKTRGRRPAFRADDLSASLDLPGIREPTEEDVTRFLCLATCAEHNVTREALKACELLMRLKRMGSFGDKNVNVNVADPVQVILDELADANPEGGLSDVLARNTG